MRSATGKLEEDWKLVVEISNTGLDFLEAKSLIEP